MSNKLSGKRIDEGMVVVCAADVFGAGDDQLGDILMRAFIKALGKMERLPAAIIFNNGGVKLTTEGSVLIDDLNAYQSAGVLILSCGTCLDFFGLKEKLLVGRASNMFEIVSILESATNVIRP